jgi:hypothetical protein
MIEDALDLAAQSKPISHAKILAVEKARLVNTVCGAPVVTPWDVDQLDDEWLMIFEGLYHLPQRTAAFQSFEEVLKRRRAQHPTFRKYLH